MGADHLDRGAKGRLQAKAVALRCYRVDGDGTGGQRHLGWLLGQRPTRGQGPKARSGPRKYLWSNCGAQTPLAVLLEYAHRRHWIEHYYERAKGELGWDQFQGRRYVAFHKNAATVMRSYSFVVWLEWRERQQVRRRGPKRRRFSHRPDRRRRTLPQIHRVVADWLLQAAPQSEPTTAPAPPVSTLALTKHY